MKVIGIYGSPLKEGNSSVLVDAVLSGAREKGADVDKYYLDQMNIHGCKACGACHKKKDLFCVQKDDMQTLYQAINDADAVVIGSPVYMALPCAQAILFLNRLYGLMYTDETGKGVHKISPKKVVTVYAQGAPMPEYYNANYDIADANFGKMLQTSVFKRLVAAGGFDETLIADAQETGKQLAENC